MTTTSPPALLRRLFDAMPVGVAVFDRNLQLLEWNETWAGFIVGHTGTTHDQIRVGAPVSEVLEETAEALERLFRRVLQGETIRRNAVALQGARSTSYWDLVFSPLVEGSEIVGVIDYATDATARVLAARDAEEGHEQFRQIFDATSDAVIIQDAETLSIVEANEACFRMHGYARDEFLALRPDQFIHPDSIPLFEQYLSTTLAGGEFRARATDVRKDGTSFDIDVMGTGFIYRGRLHLLAVIRDITEQLEHERDLALRAQIAALGDEVGRTLTRGGDLRPMLQSISQALVDNLGAAFARIWVTEPAAAELHLEASAGIYTHLDGPHGRIPLRHLAAGGVSMEQTPHVTNDVLHDPLVEDKDWAEREGIVAFAGYPMLIENELVGALGLFLREPISHDLRHALASIATAIGVGIKREQAEAEVREARLSLEARVAERTREIQGMLDVSHAMLSTLYVGELLEVVLEHLRTVIPYTGCSILRYENQHITIAAARLLPAEDGGRSAVGLSYRVDDRNSIWHRVVGGETVVIRDIRGDTREAGEYRRTVGAALSTTYSFVRSWMAVPLKCGDLVLGMLTMSRDDPDFFTTHHADLAAAFANQAAVAIANAELFAQVQRRAREMEGLAGIASALTFDQPTVDTLNVLAQRVTEATTAVACSVTIYDQRQHFQLAGTAGLPPGFADAIDASVRRGRAPSLTADTLRAGARRILRNVRAATLNDSRFAPAHAIFQDLPWDIIVISPLTYRGRALGTLDTYYPADAEPDVEELTLVGAIADQAAVAVENARLFGEAERRASLEERQRLARELHDSVSQALYGIALGAKTARTQLDRDPSKVAEPLEYVISLAEAGLAELRSLIFELRPESLETDGLVAAFEKQIATLRARHNLEVIADFCQEPAIRLELKETLYRIGQEAMNNTAKHARATTVHLRLAHSDDELFLEVTDDGVGFDPLSDFPGHLGLRSMAERAAAAGATFAVESSPGAGTAVRLRVPFHPAQGTGSTARSR